MIRATSKTPHLSQ